ncbi:hypothetical protein EYF80_046658 [Liparis tanakae]|uniref:Uncharacterized protein n=1 Tax=Liparis tanakae TaxID=230148 RepID=A0A4Z2FR24_9TELE|nr:hypothetical protein EYF80_046658 [Liparis tanakae]
MLWNLDRDREEDVNEGSGSDRGSVGDDSLADDGATRGGSSSSPSCMASSRIRLMSVRTFLNFRSGRFTSVPLTVLSFSLALYAADFLGFFLHFFVRFCTDPGALSLSSREVTDPLTFTAMIRPLGTCLILSTTPYAPRPSSQICSRSSAFTSKF